MFLNASLLFFGSGPEGCYGWSGNCLIQQSLALMSPRAVDDNNILKLTLSRNFFVIMGKDLKSNY